MELTELHAPLETALTMNSFHRPWCIAGGWAIDLWLGRVTRDHADVEVALLREDQMELRDFLPDWRFFLVDTTKKLRAWKDRQFRMLPIHEIHSVSPDGEKIEFLLNESDGWQWRFRRDSRVALPLDRWIIRGIEGLPILATEIVLLYKSKNPRPQDQLDFRQAIDALAPGSRDWLADAITLVDAAHPWIETLREA